MGACLGAAASAVWAGLDWFAILYTDWTGMALLVGAGALIGAVVGALRRVPEADLTASIDRRAGLEDRLATARERSGDEEFDAALRHDADTRLAAVQPKQVYPVRVDRWHAGTVGLAALAAMVFLLGNTPLLLSETAKREREEVQAQGKKVERVTRENLMTPEARQEMSEAERKLAQELRKLQRDLEKARLTKEEALQRSNEIAKEAEKLAKEGAEKSLENMDQAQTALERMQKAELDKAGLQNADLKMAQVSQAQREAMRQEAKKRADAAQKELEALKKQLDALSQKLQKPGLSEAERKALEEQKKALEQKMSDAQKANAQAQNEMKGLELSEEARQVLDKLMNDPLFKEMQEIAEKLKQNAEQGKQSGQPQLSKEQLKEMQKQLEEMLKKLKDDKAMQEMLKKMLEALRNAEQFGKSNGVCMGLMPGLLPIPGGGGPGSDQPMPFDTGRINKLDKPLEAKGKSAPTMISGQRREGTGPEAYVEIKAPTNVGNRSSVPYKKVLPSYRRKAESALNRQQIPKEHEKRVKEYFESLGK